MTTLGEDDEDGDDDGGASQQLDDLLDELSGEMTNSTEIMDDDEDEDEEDPIELVEVDEDFYYMAHVMRLMAILHSLVSLAMLIAYYHLKVNLHTVNISTDLTF